MGAAAIPCGSTGGSSVAAHESMGAAAIPCGSTGGSSVAGFSLGMGSSNAQCHVLPGGPGPSAAYGRQSVSPDPAVMAKAQSLPKLQRSSSSLWVS